MQFKNVIEGYNKYSVRKEDRQNQTKTLESKTKNYS